MKGGLLLAVGLVVGLAVGGGVGYLGGGQYGGSAKTVTSTTAITVLSTATGPTTGAGGQVDLQAALNNTVKPQLTVTSYSFGKGTLTVWFKNNGTEPFAITSHVPFLNGTTDTVASLISLDSNVVHIGSYLYVPPGSTFIVGVDGAGFYKIGQIGVLTIYGDSWNFAYGTSQG